MLQWSEQYETGHERIDAQHRMLFSYLNQLEEHAQSTNPSREDIETSFRFVEFLEEYVMVHFQEEEHCMHRFRCPVHAENQKAHATFLEFFNKFRQRLKANGYRHEMLIELNDACSNWISSHIMRIDLQLKPCQTPGDKS